MTEPDRGTDFEAFVLETSAAFSRVARAEAGGDLHSAEDAVQVAYMRMFTSWEKIVARPGNRAALRPHRSQARGHRPIPA
ncbi:hypothetical protein TPA0910_88200 [Streptomyces hygroscopicus subsp. sporocinereus]|uniref:RNA polymerase sigma-70 region 2 domain-containing protein n=1 Tax=Streptomyces hygroscopicus TaxID=1912 RepID=A0ABQ3UFJ8_STRHY|nr:hypothetical protein [Streptomyces hygroscopicus]GHJ34387.1 hypothetical protein TPA0910_88200 [Streptomyces hygroscopicus]